MKGRSGHHCPLFRICVGLSYWTGKPRPMSYTPCPAACYLRVPPHLRSLSSNSAGMDGSHQSSCPRLRSWLPSCLQKELTWTLSTGGGKALWWTMENTHHSPSTERKRKLLPTTPTRKSSSTGYNWDSSAAKQACQRQLLFVNKYKAQRIKLLPFCTSWRSSAMSGFSAAPVFLAG